MAQSKAHSTLVVPIPTCLRSLVFFMLELNTRGAALPVSSKTESELLEEGEGCGRPFDGPFLVPMVTFSSLPSSSLVWVIPSLLTCPGKGRLHQTVDISLCLLEAVPQFTIVEGAQTCPPLAPFLLLVTNEKLP